MAIRRDARERAVQFLFQYEINPASDLDAALDDFWLSQNKTAIEREKTHLKWKVAGITEEDVEGPDVEEMAIRSFADPLIKGVIEHRDELDEKIRFNMQNWSIHRLATVDRNVLRLAVYEMLYRFDIPPVVTINEAVDIAKKFSTTESGGFVNGILDRIKADLMRPARVAE